MMTVAAAEAAAACSLSHEEDGREGRGFTSERGSGREERVVHVGRSFDPSTGVNFARNFPSEFSRNSSSCDSIEG